MLTQTLAEQMQITERELKQRKELLNFGDEDALLLTAHKEFITQHIDEIVDYFYSKQIETPEIALLIGDIETLRLLRNAMRRYILELFDGHYDSDYVNRRLRIGKVHKRIGVSPKLYLSAVWLLQSILNEGIDRHVSESGAELKASLNKLITLDTELIFDTYISSLMAEVDAAREEMSNYAASLEEVVAQRTKALEEMSRKDALTGLLNQRAFHESLRKELATASRYNDALCLVYFDLNRFKQLNDGEGHTAGDEVLALVGRTVLNSIRVTDAPCRYGGDEFSIIMPRTRLEDAQQVCERIIKLFGTADNHGVTLSIGIIQTGPEKFHDPDILIKGADKLMYASKKKARSQEGSHITVA